MASASTQPEPRCRPLCPLLGLPPEVLVQITSRLPPREKASLAVCCLLLEELSADWFEEVQFQLPDEDLEAQPLVDGFSAWLARRRPHIRRLAVVATEPDSPEPHPDEPYAAHYVQQPAAPSLPWPPLHSLRELRLSGCSASRHYQANIAAHTGLTQLSLVWCAAGEVWPLASLTALQSLDLSCSRLSVWALGPLATLRALHTLRVSRCGMHALPVSWTALTALTSLDVGGYGLTGFAEEPLAALTALQELRCCGNGRLAAAPADWACLACLPCLRVLALSNCQVERVPAEAAALTALQELYLDGNPRLRDGWCHLARLPALRLVDARRCPAEGVAEARSLLSAVQELRC